MSWILPLTRDGQIDYDLMARRESRPLFGQVSFPHVKKRDRKGESCFDAMPLMVPECYGSRFFFWLGPDAEND